MYQQEKEIMELQRKYYDNLAYNNSLLKRTNNDLHVNSVLYEDSRNLNAQMGYSELR